MHNQVILAILALTQHSTYPQHSPSRPPTACYQCYVHATRQGLHSLKHSRRSDPQLVIFMPLARTVIGRKHLGTRYSRTWRGIRYSATISNLSRYWIAVGGIESRRLINRVSRERKRSMYITEYSTPYISPSYINSIPFIHR